MTKTNKQKTLEGCKFLIDKYENYDPDFEYFSGRSCPFCKIYARRCPRNNNYCIGCFMADKHGEEGCLDFESHRWYKKIRFIKRAEFFRRVIPILEKWPSKRFTPKGWKYSGDEIPRTW